MESTDADLERACAARAPCGVREARNDFLEMAHVLSGAQLRQLDALLRERLGVRLNDLQAEEPGRRHPVRRVSQTVEQTQSQRGLPRRPTCHTQEPKLLRKGLFLARWFCRVEVSSRPPPLRAARPSRPRRGSSGPARCR